jgi:hypothetical protein
MPERISLDVWGYATVDAQELETKRLLTRARRVVRACPAGALTVQGDVSSGIISLKDLQRGPRPGRIVSHRPFRIKNSGEL